MAIAVDATATGSTTGTSLSYSHTISGSDRILFVGCYGAVNSDLITGATYEGNAMTLINKVLGSATSRYTYLFYIIAPATGTGSIVISASGSTLITAVSASYTGVNQSSPIDVSGTDTSTGTGSNAHSLTTTVDNDWMLAVMVDNNGAGQTAGANTTQRRLAASAEIGIYDTNAAITPPAATTLNVNLASGTADWGSVAAAFSPVPTFSRNPTMFQVFD